MPLARVQPRMQGCKTPETALRNMCSHMHKLGHTYPPRRAYVVHVYYVYLVNSAIEHVSTRPNYSIDWDQSGKGEESSKQDKGRNKKTHRRDFFPQKT